MLCVITILLCILFMVLTVALLTGIAFVAGHPQARRLSLSYYLSSSCTWFLLQFNHSLQATVDTDREYMYTRVYLWRYLMSIDLSSSL
ncbi:uncharacterized protein BO80DRAFT_422255, partial [Aspergillus ibericus CBS 121593]